MGKINELLWGQQYTINDYLWYDVSQWIFPSLLCADARVSGVISAKPLISPSPPGGPSFILEAPNGALRIGVY